MGFPQPEEVAALLRECRRMAPQGGAGARFLRVEFPVDHVEPLAWLETRRGQVKTYWADRGSLFEVAGVGAASLIMSSAKTALGAIAAALDGAPEGVRYYGGLAFAPESARCGQWDGFGEARFLVPRFEVVRRQEQRCRLAVNVLVTEAADVDALMAEYDALLGERSESVRALPGVSRVEVRPSRAEWGGLLADTLAAIREGLLEKAVLARATTYDCDGAVEPLAFLRQAAVAAQQTFRFCLQIGEHDGFVGASPERLYRREGRAIESEAVAGTRPRGASAGADDALAAQLIGDGKERREHAFVADGIGRSFAALCEAGPGRRDGTGVPEVLKLQDCQHLVYRLSGRLRESVTDSDIVAELHPTAAVCGTPSAPALDWILRREPVARGWYAGPVGWVGARESEFAVAIRSARVLGGRVVVYGGAGIVEGSEAEREWREIDAKTALFARLLSRDAVVAECSLS